VHRSYRAPWPGKDRRQQTERLVRLANHQFVEIQMNARQSPPANRPPGSPRQLSSRPSSIPESSALQGLGHLRDAVQADDRQRAMHLVNMGAAELELGDVAGLVKAESLFRQRSSARSISPLTQVRGPKSNSVAAFIVSRDHIGQSTLKPATEPFSSEASAVSSSTASAVRCVPAVVCSVTLQDVLHQTRHLGRRVSLVLRRGGNALNEVGQVARHLTDFGQCLTGRVGQLGPFNHTRVDCSMAETASWVSV
jgi:hypothetical protein